MKQEEDLISVIVPIYKVELYLNQCIESIVKQTYHNLEIILVDDGSPDNCGGICDEWAKKDCRIKVIHKLNGGLSDARNAGIEIATGNYIAFVDSDDWIEPNMYELMIRALKKEKADFCACGIIDSYKDKDIIHPCKPCVGTAEDILSLIYQDAIFSVATWNKLYCKECWENLRFPTGKICEDAFTTYLVVDKSKRIVQLSDALYHYRIRENSIMTAEFRHVRMDEEEAWRNNYQYMREHYPQIAKLAYNFYLQKVNVLIHTIVPEQRKVYYKEYRYLYEILKKNFIYVLLKSGMDWKYRIKFFVDYVKLSICKG